MIVDPEAVKPEDWDEDAPKMIPDEKAEKPATWCDDCPSVVPDPNISKPEEWNDEDDGEWTAPSIANPKCAESGCGKWEPPQVKNPKYKGKWTAPMIKNPAFVGKWAPKKIPNPDYFEDLNPAALSKIGAIGFELWNMKSNILFDNIYIGHSIEDASRLAIDSWAVKNALEKENTPKPKKGLLDEPDLSENKYVAQAQMAWHATKLYLNEIQLDIFDFIDIIKHEPLNAFKQMPHVPFILASIVLLPMLAFSFFFGGSKKEEGKCISLISFRKAC